ncbi:DUF4124 domain-containing protein [Pseudomonas citronellolis]|uniref:DUF4124 domain-containing protein n=1 Tax=Pseudomonas citronellolis TaxID=53408 RepID=UPI0023E3617E|nr:DUF4124 domain-containing protein [Pseudomonas citronellolis]MDF3934576.1 DUF4124 domain-containing protein [Pseudomonas citronellolis]
MRARLLFGLLALFCVHASAEVYTYIDKDGNRVYTDQPRRSNAQRLNLAPANGMPTTPPLYAPAAPVEPPQPPQYQVLRILVPEPDAIVRANNGDLIVTVSSDPNLLPGHNYRLFVDGVPAGAPSRSPVFPLQNLDRGTHQLSVEIVDQRGQTLEQTPNQPFHMRRVSFAEADPAEQPALAAHP